MGRRRAKTQSFHTGSLLCFSPSAPSPYTQRACLPAFIICASLFPPSSHPQRPRSVCHNCVPLHHIERVLLRNASGDRAWHPRPFFPPSDPGQQQRGRRGRWADGLDMKLLGSVRETGTLHERAKAAGLCCCCCCRRRRHPSSRFAQSKG